MSESFEARTIGEVVADPGDDASHWPVDRLIDHIVATHHAYVRSAVPRIAGYLTRLTEDHGTRHPELARIAAEFDTLGRDLLEHLLKEEYVLFPYIRELAGDGAPLPSPFGTVENPIRMMEREHEDASAHVRAIRRLSADYTPPADGCSTYHVCFDELAQFERDLHRHIHLEDNVLFPTAVELETSRR
ncbi:MAG: hemerythrin domain-containing protein [Acidobacteria bacterium]|nr:hemerythrin domain-containing protein [Acidobacteriota bacterium]